MVFTGLKLGSVHSSCEREQFFHEISVRPPVISKRQLKIARPTESNQLSESKSSFLAELSSHKGKNQYKRYLGAPIRYAGGKSLAVGLIIDKIPTTIKRIVSPFLGGGSVEVACAKELGLPVIAFEIFDILVTYWKVQLHDPEALYERLLQFEPTREGYKRVKVRLKKHWLKQEMLDDYDLAAHFYFSHNTSYGPHFLGWPSSVYLNKERYQALLEKVRYFRVPKLRVELCSFEKTLQRYPNDFLYCDPPYYLDGDSKTFIGLYPHRNFPIHHKGFDHEKLRDMLHSHKGGFILSYNDCSTIREWYKGFQMIYPSWQYTLSQGDTRIGVNRLNNNNGSHVKKSHELLIWKLP